MQSEIFSAKAGCKGKEHGRLRTETNKKEEVKKLFANGTEINKSDISRQLKIGRTSVIRLLNENQLIPYLLRS